MQSGRVPPASLGPKFADGSTEIGLGFEIMDVVNLICAEIMGVVEDRADHGDETQAPVSSLWHPGLTHTVVDALVLT